MGVRESNLSRCGVIDDIVDYGTFTVGIGAIDGTITIIIQPIAGKGQDIGQIAGIELVGHNNIVRRSTCYAAAAGLIG